MFGLIHLVIRAERGEWQDSIVKVNERSHLEAQSWLRRHMVLFLVAGVLALLIIGVSAS